MESWAVEIIQAIGYLGIAALMVAECLFPPIPSEAILPFAGFLVGEGRMSFPLALGAATAGSLVGNLGLYLLARRGGRPAIDRFGRRIGCPPERLARLDRWMARHGAATVLGGRAVPLVRSAVSVPAGLSRFPAGRFILLTTIGASAWNAALLLAGWMLDDTWRRVGDVLGPASLVVAAAAGLVAVLVVLAMRRRRRPAPAGR